MAKATYTRKKTRTRKGGGNAEPCHICHGTGYVPKQSKKK